MDDVYADVRKYALPWPRSRRPEVVRLALGGNERTFARSRHRSCHIRPRTVRQPEFHAWLACFTMRTTKPGGLQRQLGGR